MTLSGYCGNKKDQVGCLTKDYGDFISGLPDSVIRWILVLCMAANDITLSTRLIREHGETSAEAAFFHRMVISFLRELANSIHTYENVVEVYDFLGRLDNETQGHYNALLAELRSFDEASLAKNVLKPIRDISFHYPDGQGKDFIECVAIFKALDKKEVRFSADEKLGPLGHRYLFADLVSGQRVFEVLDTQKVDRISRLVISLMGFVDHTMDFLVTQHKKDS